MSLFDYSRKMDPSEEPVLSEELESAKEAAVPTPTEEFIQGPVVLRHVAVENIRASMKPGFLRIDFLDEESDTGKGFMFVTPSDVRQSQASDGMPIAGKSDVVISSDGQVTRPYFVVKNGKSVRSNRSVSSFVSMQNELLQKDKSVLNDSVGLNKEGIYEIWWFE